MDLKHRKHLRLTDHDYSMSGWYSVTICTQNRWMLFGEVRQREMWINSAGIMVQTWWHKIPARFPSVCVDAFVVMPNHIHGILHIKHVGDDPCVVPHTEYACPTRNSGMPVMLNTGIAECGRTHWSAPTISHILQWLKTMTTNDYIRGVHKQGWPAFQYRLWQRSFHDYIIRTPESLEHLRDYIRTNPEHWEEDEMCRN